MILIPRDYSLESLRDYFSQFGEVQECTVMRDSATGRSRGFGFLTFRDAKTVNTVMVKEHYLDGKIVSPKREDVLVKHKKNKKGARELRFCLLPAQKTTSTSIYDSLNSHQLN